MFARITIRLAPALVHHLYWMAQPQGRSVAAVGRQPLLASVERGQVSAGATPGPAPGQGQGAGDREPRRETTPVPPRR